VAVLVIIGSRPPVSVGGCRRWSVARCPVVTSVKPPIYQPGDTHLNWLTREFRIFDMQNYDIISSLKQWTIF